MTTDSPRIDPVTRAVASSPKLLAGVLLVLALACLVPLVTYGGRAFFPPQAPRPAEGSTEAPAPPPVNPNRPEHIAYSLGGLIGLILCLGLAGYTVMASPTLPESDRLTRARTSILAAGSLLGGAVMLFGLILLIVWFESITKWLDAGDTAEAHRVLIPIIVVLLGAALMFLGAQPARAEERNNPTVRRLIYGTNLGLTALLLLFALLAGNILLALRLPNKLDTTETGFYTLSETTRKILGSLDQPLTVMTNVSDRRREEVDVRRLLEACQEVNPAQFQVKYVSNTFDPREIDKLKKKYPQFNFDTYWVLLATGEDASRAAFLPVMDFFAEEGADARGRGGREVFQGESKLMREVLFLADSKVKPVVYFTQGHGELSLSDRPDAMGSPGRTAKALKTILEKNYIDVRSLTFDLKDPKVPDDASVVIIADPRRAFSPEEATALERYMAADLPDKRRGKLIVLSSPYPNADGKGVADTGLEALLLNYSILLGKEYVVSNPVQGIDPLQQVGAVSAAAMRSGNSIGGWLFSEQFVLLPNCRRVDVRRAPADGSGATGEVLIVSELERYTWFDPDPPTDPESQFRAMARSPDLMKKYRLTQNPVPLAATVSEGGKARLLVVGSGAAFADGTGGPRSAQPPVALVSAGVDWLRDRPSVATISKPYQTYTLPRSADGFRLFWLPVGLVLLAVTVAGLGVWVVRRK